MTSFSSEPDNLLPVVPSADGTMTPGKRQLNHPTGKRLAAAVLVDRTGRRRDKVSLYTGALDIEGYY